MGDWPTRILVGTDGSEDVALAFRVAADVPEGERSKFEIMRTDSQTYQKVVEAQRNRGGPWTKVAAGHIDLCLAPIPVREAK